VPTVSPLGADGAVVSATVVAVTGSLGVDALYMASNAVTLNVSVWPGRSPDHVAVVCGWATDTTPSSPSCQSEYERTPTLSVDGSHARVTLACVTAVTCRLVGCEGGVRSGAGGRGLAAAGAPAAIESATVPGHRRQCVRAFERP
jgi:hypothetical protein